MEVVTIQIYFNLTSKFYTTVLEKKAHRIDVFIPPLNPDLSSFSHDCDDVFRRWMSSTAFNTDVHVVQLTAFFLCVRKN